MLESTNATLYDSIASEDEVLSEEDSKLFQDTIQENEDAILAQKERIEMCIFVLKKRLGIDPTNKHYDLDPNTTAITAREVTPPTPSTTRRDAARDMTVNGPNTSAQTSEYHGSTQTASAEEGQEGGMYL